MPTGRSYPFTRPRGPDWWHLLSLRPRWAIPVSCLGEFIRVIYHLRRGYDRLAEELSGVGTSIELIDN